jgi:hypothetical protein
MGDARPLILCHLFIVGFFRAKRCVEDHRARAVLSGCLEPSLVYPVGALQAPQC